MDTFDAFCRIDAAFGLFLIVLDFGSVTFAIIRKKEYKSMCGDAMEWFHVHGFWWIPPLVLFLFVRGIFLL
jgi:hypothetical protein